METTISENPIQSGVQRAIYNLGFALDSLARSGLALDAGAFDRTIRTLVEESIKTEIITDAAFVRLFNEASPKLEHVDCDDLLERKRHVNAARTYLACAMDQIEPHLMPLKRRSERFLNVWNQLEKLALFLTSTAGQIGIQKNRMLTTRNTKG